MPSRSSEYVRAKVWEINIRLLLDAITSHARHLNRGITAATAIKHNGPVFTANLKHFDPIEGLRVEAFTP